MEISNPYFHDGTKIRTKPDRCFQKNLLSNRVFGGIIDTYLTNEYKIINHYVDSTVVNLSLFEFSVFCGAVNNWENQNFRLEMFFFNYLRIISYVVLSFFFNLKMILFLLLKRSKRNLEL